MEEINIFLNNTHSIFYLNLFDTSIKDENNFKIGNYEFINQDLQINYIHGIQTLYYFKKEDGYEVFMEKTVKSYDLTDKKNCDIVVNKNGSIVLIIPTKIVMTNYKQNKSNYFSNLIGELTTLVLANPGVKVVPLNIYFTQTPYLTDNAKKIKNFEKITYEKDLKNFDRLKIIDVSERGHAPLVLAYDVINYIFDIDHVCDVGKKFDKVPINIRFNADTPFRSFESIFKEIV